MIHTSLDDAFASMMQFMTISSRQCKVSFKCRVPEFSSRKDKNHLPQLCLKIMYSLIVFQESRRLLGGRKGGGGVA